VHLEKVPRGHHNLGMMYLRDRAQALSEPKRQTSAAMKYPIQSQRMDLCNLQGSPERTEHLLGMTSIQLAP